MMSYLITLSEDMASLRVTQDHPVYAAVLDHRRAKVQNEIIHKHLLHTRGLI